MRRWERGCLASPVGRHSGQLRQAALRSVARRSTAADRKAATKTTTDDLPARSFTSLLDHLATLTRNDIRFLDINNTPIISQLALPTPTQRRAFELLGTPIPLKLK